MNKYLKLLSNIAFAALLIGLIIFFAQSELFADLQRNFNDIFIASLQQLKENLTLSSVFYLLPFAVLYGAFHAVGPGHGKLLLSAFLLNDSNNYKKGLIASLIATITHVGMAVILAYLLKYVFTGLGHFARINMLANFKTISGIIILTIGLIILFAPLFKKLGIKSKILTHTIPTGIIAGIIPCPLSMTILLVSISFSIEILGLIFVAAIALGILLFLSLFTLLFVFFKKNSLGLGRQIKLPVNLHYLQSGFYICVGLFIALL